VLTLPLCAAIVVAACIGFAATSAYTANNAIPATSISQYTHSIGPNDLKPAACTSLTLTHLVLGNTNGGSGLGADLVLGTPSTDTITETVGHNCIIGGAGTDSITASTPPTDICIISTTSTQKHCATIIIQP
jgi:hypothetical protein